MAIALGSGPGDCGPDGLGGQKGRGRYASRPFRFFAPPSGITNAYSSLSIVSSEIPPPEPDGLALPPAETARQVSAADLDPRRVKESFARVASHGPAAMAYFYARLFTASPAMRALFPLSMTAQREHAFAALTQVIWSLDNEPGCAEILGQIGRDHRRFGVTDRHHRVFFTALQDTARHFIGDAWTAETETAWRSAVDYMSAAMRSAADDDAATFPAWWIAEIVSHELRCPGVAVLRLQPTESLPYEAGQYVPVQVSKWPRIWRTYSIANAPRPGGDIDLHVRAVPGGLVSNALVEHSAVGDCVVLGAPAGGMILGESDRDLLCVAGGTGLSPIKAIIEGALSRPLACRPKKITLFIGARQHRDLYDLEDLQLLESACPALRVIPVLSEEPGYGGLTGTLPEVIGGRGLFENTEAYVCGPVAMVRLTTAVLAAGIPASQLHYDPLP